MCSCHSILECCVMFSGVKLSIRSFVLFLMKVLHVLNPEPHSTRNLKMKSLLP